MATVAKGWIRTTLAGVVAKRRRLAAEIVRLAGTPTLHELFQASASWHQEPGSFIQGIVSHEDDQLAVALADASNFCTALIERAAARELFYPDYFAAELGTLVTLHTAIRLTKPALVLETGVANGLSTEVILNALGANGHGVLHSVDIRDDVGVLVSDRTRWNLHLVDRSDTGAFDKIVAELPKIDLFFHDADHHYAPQMREFAAVWPRLTPGGLLLSDDVDASYAFLDFTAGTANRPTLLLDRRKVTGLIIKSASIQSDPRRIDL